MTKNALRTLHIDQGIIYTTLLLTAFGLVMVASASFAIADKQLGQPFYYLFRQAIFLLLGFSLLAIVVRIPLRFFNSIGPILLLFSTVLLVLVLIPGIGHEVNGSRRWLRFGAFALQPSELVKLSMVIYLSGYLLRRQDEVQQSLSGFIKPIIILGVVAALLLGEPDFGALVVISLIYLGMMFLAGVKLRHFLLMTLVLGCIFLLLAVSSPYRWERLTGFLNPWDDQFNTGYQLTQALIAFGRGAWFGVGLGSGLAKLFYLPEAHTDFMFAVIGEELGLMGACSVLVAYGVLICRGFLVARLARAQQQLFASYLAYGLSLWLAWQAIISMGVNIGLLPTKGLTLPLLSSGGSSLLVLLIAIGLLLRVGHEANVKASQGRNSNYHKQYGHYE